jgi:acrylyl-CoA reductase (NADPH)
MDFPGSVAPFILRGVTLVGINSVFEPMHEREEAWARLAHTIDLAKLDLMSKSIALGEAIPAASALIEGKIRGRLVVAMGTGR